MKRYKVMARWAGITSFSVFLAAIWTLPSIQVVADKATDQSVTQSVTQAYGADVALQKGMIVKLQQGDTTKVAALDQQHSSAMLGVVVAANDATVTLTSDNQASRQVFVATFGRYETLVSNQNGAIKKGDYITISSLDGIGMKADAKEPFVIGKANTDFTGTSDVVSSTTIKNADGQNKGISIGRISLTITVAHNPLQENGNSAALPGILQRVGAGIANKPVSASRMYLALAVLLITAMVAGSLLYGAVRSGVTSIGRNPLARTSILRGMFQVVLTSLIVFILGLFGVYLLLRL